MAKKRGSILDAMGNATGYDQPQLELPFKAFTRDELQRIVGCPGSAIDYWIRQTPEPDPSRPEAVLVEQRGDVPGPPGLDYAQAFAVFCGWKWLEEGAGNERATAVVAMLGSTGVNTMKANLERGLNFPVPEAGCFIHHYDLPPGPLAQRLRLDRLAKEYEARLKEVFGE
jgi:hypothetical protein